MAQRNDDYEKRWTPGARRTGGQKQLGFTLCAATVKYPIDWMKRLLDVMGELGYTQLLWECKVALPRVESFPSWPYYTIEEAQEITAWASARGIEVIPEINAPAHMGIWLSAFPEFAITNAHGEKDVERLDFVRDDAVHFYENIINEYLEIFPGKYWHMGADEFDYRATFSDYPHIDAFAQQMYGIDATGHDAFIAFINRINEFVKSKGRTLRIWNDGLRETNVVHLDQDVVIEYWLRRGIDAQTLVDRGYTVMNSPQYLYHSRSVPFYGIRTSELYSGENWDLHAFDAGPIEDGGIVGEGTGVSEISPLGSPVVFRDSSQLEGIKVSLWPDEASCQTDRSALDEMRVALAYVAHIAAGGGREWNTWGSAQAEFADRTASLSLRRWRRDGDTLQGLFACEALSQLGSGPWRIALTEDGYFTLTDTASGGRLTLDRRKTILGVINERGARARLCDPAPAAGAREDGSGAYNRQKWDIIPDGEAGNVRLFPALTHMQLSSVDLAQYPPDQPRRAEEDVHEQADGQKHEEEFGKQNGKQNGKGDEPAGDPPFILHRLPVQN
ncbi:MAG: family 20 glycosylhydrolase [Actinomycetaceae bacterium]|nr:family 20 glycosylhydrolase [Actinomycetaceae bacterium]MDY6083458.1 family 20 glycosylhydrolase [Actinomycetaceae bacterium]